MGCGSISDLAMASRLPEEILLAIFQRVRSYELLCIVPSVCRRWRRISDSYDLWSSVAIAENIVSDKESGIRQHFDVQRSVAWFKQRFVQRWKALWWLNMTLGKPQHPLHDIAIAYLPVSVYPAALSLPKLPAQRIALAVKSSLAKVGESEQALKDILMFHSPDSRIHIGFVDDFERLVESVGICVFKRLSLFGSHPDSLETKLPTRLYPMKSILTMLVDCMHRHGLRHHEIGVDKEYWSSVWDIHTRTVPAPPPPPTGKRARPPTPEAPRKKTFAKRALKTNLKPATVIKLMYLPKTLPSISKLPTLLPHWKAIDDTGLAYWVPWKNPENEEETLRVTLSTDLSSLTVQNIRYRNFMGLITQHVLDHLCMVAS